MNSGVYQILNTKNNKFYIGSSCNLKRRQYEHWRLFERGDHYNKYLQRSYNKHKDFFEFKVLINCPKEYCIKLEQWTMDSLKPQYNGKPDAHSLLGFKFSDETKALKSKQTRQQVKNQKLNRHKSSKLKLTIDDVREIKKMLAYNKSVTEIAKKYKVALTTISAIKTKTTWTEIEDYIVPKNKRYLIRRTNKKSRLQKLSEEQRKEVISLLLKGQTQSSIGKQYGVTKGCISAINRSYKKFRK